MYYREHAGSDRAAPAHALSCLGKAPSVSDMSGRSPSVMCAGAIVMIGSMYGQVASYPDTYTHTNPTGDASPVAYHCLKGGTIHLARHMAAYWAADRIRVNCLSPGAFPSPKAP